MTETCYMCEKEASSKEHVPPRCLFPEKKDLPENQNLRVNLITVPSCEEHNSQKSKDDEYFMFILVSSLQGNLIKKTHHQTKVKRAISRNPHVARSIVGKSKPMLRSGNNGGLEKIVAVTIDKERFNGCVKHLVHGIYFHHFKKKWTGDIKIVSNLLFDTSSDNAEKNNQYLQDLVMEFSDIVSGVPPVGENRGVFWYKLISEQSDHGIQLSFYNDIKIVALLKSV